MSDFSSLDAAFKMREVVTTIAESVVTRLRPNARICTVTAVNVLNRTCTILFPGETDTFTARWVRHLGPNVNDVIKVTQRNNGYWVSEILEQSEGAVQVDQQMVRPRLAGGVFDNVDYGAFFGFNASGVTLALGESLYLGGFNTGDSFYNARGYFEFHWNMGFFAAQFTKWEFYWQGDDPDGDVWKVVMPVSSSGIQSSQGMQLEAKAFGQTIHFRIRRKYTSAGTYGGIGIGGVWAYANEIRRDPAFDWNVVSADAEPTAIWGDIPGGNLEVTNGATFTKGPYYDSEKFTIQSRLQENLVGGGTITWDGTNLAWSQPFRAYTGTNDFTTTGYIEIGMPADGTTINHHAGSISNQVVAGGLIDMDSGGDTNTALYYDPPMRGNGASVGGRFHLVGANINRFSIPSHWIMIAVRDSRAVGSNIGLPSLKLGTGREMDHWRVPVLGNSWVNFASGWAVAGYKKENGLVMTKGLIKNGTLNTSIFTLPVEYRPGETRMFLASAFALNSGGIASGSATAHTHNVGPTAWRLGIYDTGAVQLGNPSTGTMLNDYVSIESCFAQ